MLKYVLSKALHLKNWLDRKKNPCLVWIINLIITFPSIIGGHAIHHNLSKPKCRVWYIIVPPVSTTCFSDALQETVSALYCKVLVILGLAFPMSEVMSADVPSGFYQVCALSRIGLKNLFRFNFMIFDSLKENGQNNLPHFLKYWKCVEVALFS